jgi:Tfp pilus assembly protein PilN
MRAVNLLPRDTEREKRAAERRLPVLLAAAIGALVVAALVGGYLTESSKVGTAQRALDAANAQLAATPVPPPVKPQPTAAAADAQRQPRLQAVSLALSQRIAWDRILREFSLVLPNDVWLGSLTLSAPVAAALGAPATGLQLTGTTYSYDSVARLLSRLALIPDLSGVTLANSSRTKNLVTFGVNAGVKGAPAPPPPPVAPAPTSTDTTSGATS